MDRDKSEHDADFQKQSNSLGKSSDNIKDFVLDIGTRALLGGFFALSASFYLNNAVGAFRALPASQSPLVVCVSLLSTIAMVFFVGMIAYLYAVRLPPVSKFAGWVPAAAAVLGSFSTFGLLLLKPRSDLSLSEQLLSSILIILGNILAIYSLRYLGKSFSILPQGRQLVMGGPYRMVRHPIYLAEAIATCGAVINFLSVAAIALIACQFFFQLVRMHYEEQVLSKSFPEYKNYAAHTKRVIPFLY